MRCRTAILAASWLCSCIAGTAAVRKLQSPLLKGNNGAARHDVTNAAEVVWRGASPVEWYLQLLQHHCKWRTSLVAAVQDSNMSKATVSRFGDDVLQSRCD